MALRLPKRVQQPVAYQHSRKQERMVAKRVNGRTVPGSGSFDEKGDVRVPKVMRLECKATSNKSFSVTRDMLDAIEQAAMGAGECPVIQIEFMPVAGHRGGRLLVLPDWVLDRFAQVCKTKT